MRILLPNLISDSMWLSIDFDYPALEDRYNNDRRYAVPIAQNPIEEKTDVEEERETSEINDAHQPATNKLAPPLGEEKWKRMLRLIKINYHSRGYLNNQICWFLRSFLANPHMQKLVQIFLFVDRKKVAEREREIYFPLFDGRGQ